MLSRSNITRRGIGGDIGSSSGGGWDDVDDTIFEFRDECRLTDKEGINDMLLIGTNDDVRENK